jgi:hypothetical protein
MIKSGPSGRGAPRALARVFNPMQCDRHPPKQMRLRSVATLSVCEFIFDQSAQMISYRLMIEPLNYFV